MGFATRRNCRVLHVGAYQRSGQCAAGCDHQYIKVQSTSEPGSWSALHFGLCGLSLTWQNVAGLKTDDRGC
jgi:hypothetical protein